MASIYNTVGSLDLVMKRLRADNIRDFHTLDEILGFQKQYSSILRQVINRHENALITEKQHLNEEIPHLERNLQLHKDEIANTLKGKIDKIIFKLGHLQELPESKFASIRNRVLKLWLKMELQITEKTFKQRVALATRSLQMALQSKKYRHEYLLNNFQDALKKSAAEEVDELQRKITVIDELNSMIYGAIGELRVEQELAKLPEDFYIINDFNLEFDRAIYYPREGSYMKSIQVDHLLVSPAGVFIIETKNWSEESLNNLDLRSPISQIQRSGFAVFKILTSAASEGNFFSRQHHWGTRKIPIRNVVAILNRKPQQEFEFVKVLTIHELLRYIQYFKPVFSPRETENLKDFLLYVSRS